MGGDVELIQILHNSEVILDNAPFNGSEQDCLDEPGDYVYLVEASNSMGETAAHEVTVTMYESQPDNPLTGTSWNLVSYFDEDVLAPLVDNLVITASFTEHGEIVGSAGCNAYSAVFLVCGDAITIGTPTTAYKVCDQPAGVMQIELIYLEMLHETQLYQIISDELVLVAVIAGEERTILSFERES